GQCVQGRLFAGRPGAATGHHRWARLGRSPVAARPRTPPEAGARASLTTADRTDPRAVTPPPGALCAIVSRRAPPATGRDTLGNCANRRRPGRAAQRPDQAAGPARAWP